MLPSPWSLGFVLAAAAGAMLVPGCRPHDGPSGPSESLDVSSPQFSSSPVISDQYIVVFKPTLPDPAAQARALVAQHGGTLRFTYTSAIKGFAANLTEQSLEGLRRNPNVAYIEADQAVELFETESAPPSWGLDRVDQRKLPLSNSYAYMATGAGINVYIIDTGIRTSHVEFGGRAVGAYSSVKGKTSTDDCHGHGTHVAGTVGGSTYGIAKGVTLHAVRVLDCDGSGSYSGVIAGIDWITAHRQLPAVANMSLGGGKSQTLNDAVQGSIEAGVTYAVAAGNSNYDACSFSPASAPEALTVGATTRQDAQAYYSNWGGCVDLYAPGDSITSAWNTTADASAIKSGTSMAAPHVAGAAALYLESHPLDSPAIVASALSAAATQAQIIRLASGSPNLLVFTGDPSTAQPSPISGGSGGSKGCGNAWWKKCN